MDPALANTWSEAGCRTGLYRIVQAKPGFALLAKIGFGCGKLYSKYSASNVMDRGPFVAS